MKVRAFFWVVLLPVLPGICGRASAQERLKPLDPATAQTTYQFAIRSGANPFRFKVQLDQKGTVAGVSAFRDGDSTPFQTLPACERDRDQLTEYEDNLELLEHADLNFDGFEDLMLLQFYSPHLGTKVYCIFTWE